MTSDVKHLTQGCEILISTAEKLANPDKCLLSIDATISCCRKEFQLIGLRNTITNRHRLIELILCGNNTSQFVSGVVTRTDTASQCDAKGKTFNSCAGILPGIRDTEGVVSLSNRHHKFSLGQLYKRCTYYKSIGMRFSAWRCCLKISKSTISPLEMIETANMLAIFAHVCQKTGLVPIVELEILPEGNHDLDICRKITEQALANLFLAFATHDVVLEATLLQPSLVTAGNQHHGQAIGPEAIVEATLRVWMRYVPVAIGGIIFLSAGQGEDSVHLLNALNNVGIGKPWRITCMHGRCIQSTVIQDWRGKEENIPLARDGLIQKLKMLTEKREDPSIIGKAFPTESMLSAAKTFQHQLQRAKDWTIAYVQYIYNTLFENAKAFVSQIVTDGPKLIGKMALNKAANFVLETAMASIGPITLTMLASIVITLKKKVFSKNTDDNDSNQQDGEQMEE